MEQENIVYQEARLPIVVDACRTSSVDSVENARRALHEAVEIKYFYEGTSTLLVGEETLQVEAGDVVVINPFEMHATLDYGAKKGKYHLFMISLDFFSGADGEPQLRHLFFGQRVAFRSHFRADARLSEILLGIVAEMQKRESMHALAVRGLTMQLFAHLLRYGRRDVASVKLAEGIRSYGVIDPALCRIRDGYAEKLTVDELAELCRVSKYHFCRVFKEVMGMSALQYLNAYRIRVSDAMLENTDRSVGEIATLCGFGDESYFCRCYKRMRGQTPARRRAQVQ